MTTTKHNLTVDLLSVLLGCDHEVLTLLVDHIEDILLNFSCIGLLDWWILIAEVLTGKGITINNADELCVDLQVLTNNQILRLDVSAILAWETVTTNKSSLRKTGVIDAWLCNTHGVIL